MGKSYPRLWLCGFVENGLAKQVGTRRVPAAPRPHCAVKGRSRIFTVCLPCLPCLPTYSSYSAVSRFSSLLSRGERYPLLLFRSAIGFLTVSCTSLIIAH